MGIEDRASILIEYATRKYGENQEELHEDDRIPAEMLFEDKFQPVETLTLRGDAKNNAITKATYQRIQRKIYLTLMGQVPNEALMKIVNRGVKQGDGLGALQVLNEEYGNGRRTQGQLALFTKLMKCTQTSTIDDFVFKIQDIINSLDSAHNIKLASTLVLSIFLQGLKPEYAAIVTVLHTSEDVTLEKAIATCREFEERRQEPISAEEVKRERQSRRGTSAFYSSHKSKTIKCFNCDQMGHKASECNANCRRCSQTGQNHRSNDCPKRKVIKFSSGTTKKETALMAMEECRRPSSFVSW